MFHKKIIKKYFLIILKILLQKIKISPASKTIKIYFPDKKEALGIPIYFNEKVIYERIVQPILKTVPREKIVKIKIPNIKRCLQLRAQTSDIPTFLQIFKDKDYDILMNINPKLIIDGGANVGYASVFFANKFPKAKIIAVEPEESNFQILKENTASYQNIELIKSGIWNKDTYLKVKDIGLGRWGMTVEEVNSKEPGSFKAVTIGQLLKCSGNKEIDILKLDIEGAEKEVFLDTYEEWLSKVNLLIIELHDRIKPGCSETFYSAIRKYHFNQTQKGENIILTKVDI